jgi:heme exporter protein A
MSRFTGDNLGCIRGERAVFAGLDFALGPGELLLLTGPNGSGKSSFLRLAAGLIRPAAGALSWDGRPLARELDAHHARLHYLGHLDAVKPVLSVRENLAFWAEMRGGDAATVAAGLAAYDLEALADWPARLLSAGQKRRLALARLLVAPAALWLLDEPTVGLDLASIARLKAAVAQHRAGGGMVALATHVAFDEGEVRRLDMGDVQPAEPSHEELFW